MKNGDAYVTRSEFHAFQKEVALGFYKTHSRMDAMETRLTAKIDALADRVAGSVDACLSRLENYGRETCMLPKVLDEHGLRLRDHERRIRLLESRRKS